MKASGEVASVDENAAQEFPKTLNEIEKNCYLPQQIFNVDEMGLLLEKKVPAKTYISKEEIMMQSCKRQTMSPSEQHFWWSKIAASLIILRTCEVSRKSHFVVWEAKKPSVILILMFFSSFHPRNTEIIAMRKTLPSRFSFWIMSWLPSHLENFHLNMKFGSLPPNTNFLLPLWIVGYSNFPKLSFLHVQQAVQMTACQFWMSYDIYKVIKNIDAA